MRLLFLLSLATCFQAMAAPFGSTSLTFDGLKIGEDVLRYYDGGFGAQGSGPGPLDGVTFTPGFTADAAMIASGRSALVTGSSVTMDLDTAWGGQFSFYFTGSGTVSFYSGLNGGGTLLRTFTLTYPPFFPFGATPGLFESAVFTSNAPGTLRLDSLTFGAQVVPEPFAICLTAAGLLSVLSLRRRARPERLSTKARDSSC